MPAARTVAIACQGGGSHAAFAAGALVRLLEHARHGKLRIVALSGTSGGAMCAALAWAGMVNAGAAEAQERVRAFWRDVETHDLWDAALNAWAVFFARLPVSAEVSPYAYEPAAEPQLRALLAKHLRLEALPDDRRSGHPKLLIGATNIQTGDRTVFPGETLSYDELIASAAVPPLFRAVRVHGDLHWDGLFSTNPPVRELTDLEDRPDEIWVIQINPQRRAKEPRSMREIVDRRNELSGNLSLAQELYFIHKMNGLRKEHASLATRYKHIGIRIVELELEDLDYPSKLDRSSALIDKLLRAGAESAERFFSEESRWPRPGALPVRSVLT
jgi:NTE family protein